MKKYRTGLREEVRRFKARWEMGTKEPKSPSTLGSSDFHLLDFALRIPFPAEFPL